MNRRRTWAAWLISAVILAPGGWALAQGAPEAWLGVHLAPVPPALEAHLALDGDGVMIQNVILDSPADRAGLDRYDVIIEADGEAVSDGVEGFTRHVRGLEPGDVLALTLFRAGRTRDVEVTLGDAPDRTVRLERRYKDDWESLPWGEFLLWPDGTFLRPGPHGLRMDPFRRGPVFRSPLAPQRPSAPRARPVPPVSPDEEAVSARRVGRDGRVLEVARHPDGRIEVRRYEASQEPDEGEVRTYGSMAELRRLDREAADLLSGQPRVLRRTPAAPRGPTMRRPDFPHRVQPFARPIPRVHPQRPLLEPYGYGWRERYFEWPSERFRQRDPCDDCFIR